ncbi:MULTISPECIES: APC family permease [unclassified Streptomyces]|uniref:APC family permease n=1 Tax=Streptomyces sp. NBC_00180 TaxID=2903632 RepID=A0AAU1HR04_9ACTN|nr:APC family permease [Streptomyces sp. NBC_01017]WSV35340.1 APC family permease [Streptomyces sp. NBC_01017]
MPKEPQRLTRTIGVGGATAITLSVISPAIAVFVVASVVVTGAGSGSVWCFLAAALVGICLAFCYAELAAAFPSAGGPYVLVGRAMGPAAGFAMLALAVLQFVIPAILAQGAASYLDAVISGAGSRFTSAALIILASLISMCTIKVNVFVTGAFLILEIALLASLSILGFVHVHRPLSSVLTHPQVIAPDGALSGTSFNVILTFTAVALFAYGGYETPAYLSEETRGSSRNVAWAILLSFAITVIAEAIPVTAIVVGAPSLVELGQSESPITYFLSSVSDPWFHDMVSIGVALAAFNLLVGVLILLSRLLYGTARDRAWPDPVRRGMVRLHPKYATPITANIASTIVALGFLFVPQSGLIQFIGASATFAYILVALAALVGRLRHRTDRSPYRMPLWPLPPLLALVALGYVIKTQTAANLLWPLGLMTAAILYYLLHLRSRDDRWLLTSPENDRNTPPRQGTGDN